MQLGLAGIISSAPEAGTQRDRMAASLLRFEGAEVTRLSLAPLHIAVRAMPWVDGFHAEDAQVAIVVSRQVWDGPKRLDATELLRMHAERGIAGLATLGGSFLMLVWNKPLRELTLISDRLATVKLYYWQGADTFAFATELRALLALPGFRPEIDTTAVRQYLVTSHLVDNRSLVHDVMTLPSASTMTVTRGRGITRRYWKPEISGASDGDLNHWADRIAATLSDAVRSRCNGPDVVLPLSGGLDARAIAGFLPQATRAVSFGPPWCYDVRYGRRIANALGIPFITLDLPKYYFRDYLETMVALNDGEVSIESFPIYRLRDAGAPGSCLPVGFLGDVLSGGHLLPDPEVCATSSPEERLWNRLYVRRGFSDALLREVLLPERHGDGTAALRDLMHQALRDASAETFEERALLVELEHRQSRYVSYLARILGTRYRMEQPFMDNAVLDTFLALPLHHRRLQRAYRRMFTRHAPALAAVAEIKSHRPLSDTDRLGYLQPKANGNRKIPIGVPAIDWRLNAVRRAFGRWLIGASRGWLGPLDRDHYSNHAADIRSIATEWYRTRLLDPAQTAGWFDGRALQRLLDEHLELRHDHSTRINNIIGFLEWKRQVNL